MTNVLYIVSTLARMGPTNQLLGIVRNLDQSKFKPIVLTLSPEGDDSMIEKFLEADIEVITLGLSRLEGFFKAKARLINILESRDINLVHTSGIRADSLVSKIAPFKNTVFLSTLRNFPGEDYPVKFGALKGKVFTFVHEGLIRKMRNPVACSFALREKVKTLNSEVKAVQNGVDVERFKIGEDTEQIKSELGLDPSKKMMLFSGSLIARKQPLETAKAFLELKLSNWNLVFIGDGPLKTALENLNSDNIILKGKVSNPESFYQAADLFISASLSEGLPNSVMEALGSGVFCLLSDIEPHCELIKGQPQVGSLFKTSDHSDIKRACLEAIEKLENNDPNSISHYLKSHFSSQIMSGNYQNLYQELLSHE